MQLIHHGHDYNRLSFKTLIFFLISFFIINNYELAMAGVAPAASGSSSDPIGTQLCRIITILTGSTAKAISVVALFSIGVGLFMGKVNWGVALTTATGVVVIFGASSLVGFLGGTGVDATSCVKAAG
jgi:type IV secretion system protein VirB2